MAWMHERAALSYLPIGVANRKRSAEYTATGIIRDFSEPGYPAVP